MQYPKFPELSQNENKCNKRLNHQLSWEIIYESVKELSTAVVADTRDVQATWWQVQQKCRRRDVRCKKRAGDVVAGARAVQATWCQVEETCRRRGGRCKRRAGDVMAGARDVVSGARDVQATWWQVQLGIEPGPSDPEHPRGAVAPKIYRNIRTQHTYNRYMVTKN